MNDAGDLHKYHKHVHVGPVIYMQMVAINIG